MATRDAHVGSRTGAREGVRARVRLAATAGLLGSLAALPSLGACSASSTPNPPMLGGCMDKNGVPCQEGAVGGGGSSPPGDGATDDASAVEFGDALACTGATEIFASSTSVCIACIAASCCLNPTSCPNDQGCSSIAVCVLACLSTDPACVQGCEAQASMATITAYGDLASCSTSNCPTCPTLPTTSTGDF